MKLAAQFDELATEAAIPPEICASLVSHLYSSTDGENIITIDRLDSSGWHWSNVNRNADHALSPEKLAELNNLRPFAERLLDYAQNRHITHLCLSLLSDDEATKQSLANASKYYYTDVPGIGNVVISRHAQDKAKLAGFNEEMIEQAMMEPDGKDIPDKQGVVFRDRGLLRLVIILRPEPFRGASLVTTIIRKKPTAIAK